MDSRIHTRAFSTPSQNAGGRHTWLHLLAIICAALLSGQLTGSTIVQWAALHEQEIQQCLGPALRRVSSAATLTQALRLLDIQVLERLLGQFIERLNSQQGAAGSIRMGDGQLLCGQAVDGKELRGASAHGERLFLVSSVRHATGATLAQQALGPEDSEIAVAWSLLAAQDLSGTATTMDALHTNRATAQQILARGGHYLLVGKGNQAQPRHAEHDRDTHKL